MIYNTMVDDLYIMQNLKKLTCIYALVSAKHKEPFYVGQTTLTPHRRLQIHINEALHDKRYFNTPKNVRIRQELKLIPSVGCVSLFFVNRTDDVRYYEQLAINK